MNNFDVLNLLQQEKCDRLSHLTFADSNKDFEKTIK